MVHRDIIMNMRMVFPARQQGVALVVVLWVMILLSVMAGSYAISTRTETELTQHSMEAARGRAIAEAGVHLILGELLLGRDSETVKWRADGSVYFVEFEGTELRIAIEDESAKVDLNAAYPELIGGIVRTVAVETNAEKILTDAILDWRDVDNIPRAEGAEDSEYEAAGFPYGAKDAHFDNLEELLLIRGMDHEVYTRLSGVVSVFSDSRGINPVWASRQVLLAVPGLEQEEVDSYMQLREQSLANGFPLPSLLVNDRRYLASEEGMVYTIHVEAGMASGLVERTAAVVKLITSSVGVQERPFDILLWKEGDPYFEIYDREQEAAETLVSGG